MTDHPSASPILTAAAGSHRTACHVPKADNCPCEGFDTLTQLAEWGEVARLR